MGVLLAILLGTLAVMAAVARWADRTLPAGTLPAGTLPMGQTDVPNAGHWRVLLQVPIL